MAKLSPMMQQYMDIKEQHQDKILFFRLGDFYEMFFQDALTASKELEITLTGRDCGQEERAPMCGIPHHAAESYIARLIEKNYKVAICEQVEDPSVAKGIVKREVVRIVTPGTVTEAAMLDEKNNNFLMVLVKFGENTAISYADISTGEFFCCEAEGGRIDLLKSEIQRINPSELLTNDEELDFKEFIGSISQLKNESINLETCERRIKEQFNIAALDGFGLDTKSKIIASGALLQYIDEIQKSGLINLRALKTYSLSNFMILDQATRRNLELSETMRGRTKKGALISILDKTKTSMGSRRLKGWIEKPLIDSIEINKRLDGVEELKNDFLKGEELRDYLKSVYDIERLAGRISIGSANGRDLLALRNTANVLPLIHLVLEDNRCGLLDEIYQRIDILQDIKDTIDTAIHEEAPFAIKDGGLIKDGYSDDLDRLRSVSKDGIHWIAELEAKEREKSGIKNLKIGFNRVFGYYFDITRSNLANVPEYFIRKQTLSNSERYITPDLKELEDTVLGSEEKILALEYQLFIEIRENIAEQIVRIQTTASALSELDCICALAEVAHKYNFVKPEVDDGDEILIKNGRHPVVEALDSKIIFVPNDSKLDCQNNRMMIITGPNMAGKSTYMRQVALITLMAQAGSFVPATEAKIGICDRIFTRVGASDDLSSGQSTFMVEMSELANIINNATKKSLIILDEIGRGTSTFDGLSIAWAVVEYISDKEKLAAKTLFATHYHELTELEDKLEGVLNYCVKVNEEGKNIVFLHKIVRGGASGSYGIYVARLAGIPEKVLERADEILQTLERSEKNYQTDLYIKQKKRRPAINEFEPNLFNFGAFGFIEELKDVDVNSMTPIEALMKLKELQEKAKNYE